MYSYENELIKSP